MYTRKERLRIPCVDAGEAEDTTAAGDTFTGYFISSVIDGMPVSEGLSLAAKASAIAVSREGATASIPLKEEVLKAEL